jgi:Uri superfamily endonuclease
MPNTYALLIQVTKPFTTKVGALGEIQFEQGRYIYIGSARSDNFKRLERHARTAIGENNTLHWHIDYLLTHENTRISGAYTTTTAEECEISQAIKLDGKSTFGSSDCIKCETHLRFSKGLINAVEETQKAFKKKSETYDWKKLVDDTRCTKP